jgi:NADH dehydrogenase [ubiquinone] 1 alpha subcomplex assembly factor 7
MTALLADIRALIAAEGPISVERYMALCLGHPEHGYYMTRDPLGAAGDFTTAPEISQMFGELLGLWAAETWRHIGSPQRVVLLECGPGRGTLMADALRAAKVVPEFHAAIEVALLETSPVLRDLQVQALAEAGIPARWVTSLDELPADAPLLVIANEFLDALPIRQFIRRDGGWHERMVGLDGDRLAFGLAAHSEASLTQEAEDGACCEIAVQGMGFAQRLGLRLKAQGGAAVLIDYGHSHGGMGDTLQAIKAHAFADPLVSPGEADLTAHVDFAAIAAAAREGGARVHSPVEQGPFLWALGIDQRAQALIAKARNDAQRADIAAAHGRLTEMTPTGMGQLFKVLILTDASIAHPVGVPD